MRFPLPSRSRPGGLLGRLPLWSRRPHRGSLRFNTAQEDLARTGNRYPMQGHAEARTLRAEVANRWRSRTRGGVDRVGVARALAGGRHQLDTVRDRPGTAAP